MKIVIDIPEDTKIMFDNGHFKLTGDLILAIQRGKPLPKGHGRLIDADAILNNRWLIEKYNGELATVVYAEDIDAAPTIIEADKEAENGKEI